MKKKYQIFVSSTYKDLIDERLLVSKAILDLGHIPAGMEGFYASDEEQMSYIQKVINDCDYYILIIGGRYGSIDATGSSYTEREFEYARRIGIPILAFIHGNPGSLPRATADDNPDLVQKLQSFRDKIRTSRMVKEWTTPQELHALAAISISRVTSDIERVGWIRGDAAASEDILSELNKIRNKNEKLEMEIRQLKENALPKVDNLAPLESIVRIKYFVENSSYDEIVCLFTISISDLIKILVPLFLAPSLSREIPDALIRVISEKITGAYPKRISLEDVNQIKIQLIAMNLINVVNYGSQNKSSEFLQITDHGRKFLMENMSIKIQ